MACLQWLWLLAVAGKKEEEPLWRCVPDFELPTKGTDRERCAAGNLDPVYRYAPNERRELCGGSVRSWRSGCTCCRTQRFRPPTEPPPLSSSSSLGEEGEICPAAASSAAASSSSSPRGRSEDAAPPRRLDKIVVYTVSTGFYDLKYESKKTPPQDRDDDDDDRGSSDDDRSTPPNSGRFFEGDDDVDFIHFCDAASCPQIRQRGPKHWRVVELEVPPSLERSMSSAVNPTWSQLLSRTVKILPHCFREVWRYRASVYLDGNVGVVASPLTLVDDVASGADVATWEFNRTIDGEGRWVWNYVLGRYGVSKDADLARRIRSRVEDQVRRYKALPDVANSTLYGKAVVRKHNAKTRYFGEVWWSEFVAGIPRDQLSLWYSVAKAKADRGLRFRTLNGGMGENHCNCVGDDLAFATFFRHLGHGHLTPHQKYASRFASLSSQKAPSSPRGKNNASTTSLAATMRPRFNSTVMRALNNTRYHAWLTAFRRPWALHQRTNLTAEEARRGSMIF